MVLPAEGEAEAVSIETDRPRCKHRRHQETRVRVSAKPIRFETVVKNKPCGQLLDKTGECWFCRHVDREAREAYKLTGSCF